MDIFHLESVMQVEDELAKELDLEFIPPLEGRPRWAGRPDRIDFYKFSVDAIGLETFDEDE